MSDVDAVVIGGGIHGSSAALNLARKGLRVLVLEKERVGRHASTANAGGVRTLLRHTAEVPLALAAREIWHDIKAELGDDCGYHTVGQLAIAENEDALAKLVQRADEMRTLGYDHEEVVDRKTVQQLALGISDHVCGGLYVRDDGAANPFQATHAFRRAAAKIGVQFREGATVTQLGRVGDGWQVGWNDQQTNTAYVVNTAGAWGDNIAGLVGDTVPLRCMLPMMMVTARVQPFLKPVIINDTRPLSFKQMPNGSLLIGGGRPALGTRDSANYRLDFRGLSKSAATVRDLFPALRDVQIVRGWAGREGRFADEIPVIGRSPNAPGVFHAFGFCGHGFQLAPIVGRLIAELVVDGQAHLPIAPFAVDRFAAPA